MRGGLTARLVRGTSRLAALSALLLATRVEAVLVARKPLAERCRWRQRWCKRILRVLRIPLRVEGLVPCSGMVVSNHLTYLDILTYGAVFGGVLVSKREVRNWPLIGALTAAAGTIYVDRASVRSAAEASRAAARLMSDGLPVLVFPEGTTSDGKGVLPFQAPLFDAAVRSGSAVWPAAIRYSAHEGLAAVPYWGDMTLVPHLVRVMQLPGLSASIVVTEVPLRARDRRTAAHASHAVVQAMYDRQHGNQCTVESASTDSTLSEGVATQPLISTGAAASS